MADPTTDAAGVMPGDEETSKEIVRRAAGDQYAVEVMPLMTDDEIRRTWRLAQALSASSMFKDAKQAEQAFAKILLGRDLGLSPTQAMTGIHIVEGKPEVAAVTLASFVRRRPGVSYRVVEHTNEACEIHFFTGDDPERCKCKPGGRPAGTCNVSRFTEEDADLAGLTRPSQNGKASNHTKYPRNMFFARAMSNGVKWYVPEALGGIPVYTEGEVYQAAIEAPRQAAAAMQLPDSTLTLLRRAAAVDATVWRENEIAARLPYAHDDGYVEALEALEAEIAAWLAEHDPPDADVVDEPRRSSSDPEESAGESLETVELDGLPIDERYQQAAPEWREQVDILLHRQADLEAADPGPGQEGEVAAELDHLAAELDRLGVPRGWVPGQATLGV